MRTLNYTSIVLIEDFRISNNIAVEIRPYFCIIKLCHLFIYEKTKLLSIFSLLKALLQVPLYVIYVCAYVIYMYDILPQTVTYFPFYFSVWALLLFFKKAHMIHKHDSYSSFLKSITNLCNIYQNYSFYPVCFSICLLYHLVFIKIKIWNQCMPNESWLRKDCGVINGFSKKHMYDLDWKFSILKKNIVKLLALLTFLL